MPPTVSLNNQLNTIEEEQDTSNPIKVADIIINDDAIGEDNLSLTGEDANFFEIINNQLFVKAGTNLNFEQKANYTVTVAVNDAEVGNNPDDSVTYALHILEALTINANLVNDTGTSNSDRLTLDPTVKGRTEGATSLLGNLNGNGFVDISNALNQDGTFTISFEQYEILGDGTLPDGDYSLVLKASNNLGQESETVVNFTLDLTAPLVNFDLAQESDTGELGDKITTEYTVNLVGQTEANLELILVNNQETVTADEDGNFIFTGVSMPIAGEVPYRISTVDKAGNLGGTRQALRREGINGAPEIISTPETLFNTDQQTSYTYQVIATDPDNDALTYTLLNAPLEAEIDEKGKWMGFAMIGYSVETPEGRQIATQDIIQQIRQILPDAPASKSKNNPYGMRLKVTIRIKGFNGQQGNLITIWQIDEDKNIPRLITNWLEVYS